MESPVKLTLDFVPGDFVTLGGLEAAAPVILEGRALGRHHVAVGVEVVGEGRVLVALVVVRAGKAGAKVGLGLLANLLGVGHCECCCLFVVDMKTKKKKKRGILRGEKLTFFS